MPGNKSPTAPNLWTQSARTKGRQPTPAKAAMVTHHLHPPRTVPTAPNSTQLAEQTAQHDSHCSKCDKMGHWGPKCCGGKPLQSRNAPPPGSQQRKSRCPPRNHNHLQGQKNKTDAIDIREDHSPQDEIALHYIQPSTTVRHTHPEEIRVGDVCAPQGNEAYTTIQLPASASRKGTASLCIKVDTSAGGNVLPPLCVFTPIPRSDQSSWPTHWPRPCQYQTHCIQQIPYTSIWCTLRTHHLATKSPWLSSPQGKIILVHSGHPWSCHPGSTLK